MTKLGMKRTTIPKGLKRRVPLKAKTPMNKMTAKQERRNRQLAKISPPEDGRCQVCHNLPDFRNLVKHHLVFRSRGGRDEESNLVWVCGTCHNRYHHIQEVNHAYDSDSQAPDYHVPSHPVEHLALPDT